MRRDLSAIPLALAVFGYALFLWGAASHASRAEAAGCLLIGLAIGWWWAAERQGRLTNPVRDREHGHADDQPPRKDIRLVKPTNSKIGRV